MCTPWLLGAYTNVLIVTNQAVVLEKHGIFNNFKGIERYDYSIINQAIQGEAANGEEQLELYIGDKVEDFALPSVNELKVLIMAINDQMGPDAERYDLNYYQSIITETEDAERILELRLKAQEEMPTAEGSGMEIAGEAAKNLAKSGNFTATGVTKAVAKAMGKQKKKGILSGMVNGFLDDIGVRDIQDEFTEIGNEFREEFGLKTKMTYAEQKELKELEETRKKKELQEQKNSIFQNKVNEKKAMVDKKKKTDAEQKQPNHTIPKMSVKEQMELLQQMKSLLDSGVLTQEEFEQKKQEILND